MAILMVFAHHAFHVPLLWSGVDLFFILSGYLITSILLRDRERMTFGAMLKRFYQRRAERILPAYSVCLVLFFFFVHVDWRHLWVYYVFFLQNVPFAAGWVSDGPVLPLWSLAVEQHFYLVWPVLIFFLPRRWLAPSMAALLVLTPALRAICTPLFPRSEYIYVLTPFRMDALGAGALAAIVLPRCKPQITIRMAQASMAIGVIAYLLLSEHSWFRRGANTVAFNTFAYSLNILILGGLFVWVVLSGDTWLNRILSNKVLRGLGRISYMFYLLHLWVLVSMQGYFRPVLAALVAFVVTAALATLSWFVVEKPILSLRTRVARAAPAS